MKFALVALILAVGLPAFEAGILNGYHHDEKAVRYWGYTKALDQCFGHEQNLAYHKYILENLSACFFDFYANHRGTTFFDEVGPSLDVSGSDAHLHPRSRRSTPNLPFYHAYKIAVMDVEIKKYVHLSGCFFEKVGITISGDGSVDGSSVKSFFAGLDIPAEVKSYIDGHVDSCSAASTTGDYLQMGQENADFEKVLTFFRCAAKGVVQSCIEYDFDHNEAMFDLSGLGDSLSDLTEGQKRWYVFSSHVNWDPMGLWDGVI